MNLNKVILLLLIYLVCQFCYGQTKIPDTSTYLWNNNSTTMQNAEWKFSFVQLTDIHIGRGAPGNDFGTPGWNDTLTDAGSDSIAVAPLRHAINWINQNADTYKIKFVVITGDLTDRAEKSQFYKIKQLFDSLTIPYIPLIGNHDIWPYTDTTESPVPIGDSIFNTIFNSHFDTLMNTFSDWDNGTRLTRTYNPDANYYSYLQNFSFVYGSYLFVFSDFGTREHAPLGYPGVGPDANIYDFTGGTFPWLQQKIINYPDKGEENIFIFTHFPPTKDPWAMVSSFSSAEYGQITEFLDTLKQHIGIWFAGHMHRFAEYGIQKWIPNGIIAQGIETANNYGYPFGHFRIIKVWDTISASAIIAENNTIVNNNLFDIYPNPATDKIEIETLQQAGIEIINSQGQLIKSIVALGKTTSVDISEFPCGMYFIKLVVSGTEPVKTSNGITVKKLIKI